jgi:release factor glutamine methyltransferase
MRIADALAGTPLPRADAEVLLAHVLNKDRAWLLAHGTDELSAGEWTTYTELTARRRTHEPVSQILGSVEFYGRRFIVSKDVLTPRPSTEGIVRGALAFLDGERNGKEIVDEGITVMRQSFREMKPTTIVDIGTGSGCIAITLKLERPALTVIASDVSPDAVAVAKKNAKALKADVDVRVGSLLDPIQDLTEPFLLVSNPPYISNNAVLMKDVVDFEPHVALFGGNDGGDIVRKILADAKSHPACVGCVLEGKSEHFA